MTLNNDMNKIIAITGGIGSGKSTALKVVEKLGFMTFSADETYKKLTLNEDFVKEISLKLDIEPLTINEKLVLNKAEISKRVFSDKNLLKTLNNFTHPRIMSQMISEAKRHKGLVFCEVPLLFEGGFESLFDYVLIIKRNDNNRFESASKRDGKTIEQIKKIAKNQFDYTIIQENAHTFIIENNNSEELLAENLKIAISSIKK